VLFASQVCCSSPHLSSDVVHFHIAGLVAATSQHHHRRSFNRVPMRRSKRLNCFGDFRSKLRLDSSPPSPRADASPTEAIVDAGCTPAFKLIGDHICDLTTAFNQITTTRFFVSLEARLIANELRRLFCVFSAMHPRSEEQ